MRALGGKVGAVNERVGIVQTEIVALPRGLEDRLAVLQGAIVQMGERMTRHEQLAEARDANIQAVLLRLLQGTGK